MDFAKLVAKNITKTQPVKKNTKKPIQVEKRDFDHPRHRILKKLAEKKDAANIKAPIAKKCCQSVKPKNTIINTSYTNCKPFDQKKKHNCSCNSCDGSKTCKCCPKPTHTDIIYLTQEDFKCGGIILDRPAYYKFACDIVFSPAATTTPTSAIVIQSSDVVLDLGNHTLKQGNKTPLVYGILIQRDVKRVKITGQQNVAAIIDFTLAGIRVLGRTRYITIEKIITEQTVNQQYTNDQIPASCADLGSMIVNLGIAVGEGDITGVHMQNTSTTNLVKNLTISKSVIKGSFVGLQTIFTFGMLISENLFTENTFIGFIAGPIALLPGDGEAGIVFPTAGDAVIDSCRYIGNRAKNGELANPADTFFFAFIAGSEFSQVINFSVKNCFYSDNENDDFIIAADHDRAQNVKWENCIVARTRSDFGAVLGLHMSGSIPFVFGSSGSVDCFPQDFPLFQDINNTFKNCTVFDTVTNGAFISWGFSLSYAVASHVSNCNVSGTAGNGGRTFGFLVEGDIPGGLSNAVTLENCTAENNGIKAGPTSAAGGFCVDYGISNVVLKNLVANNNGTDPETIATAGIMIDGRASEDALVSRNIDVDNCTAIGNGNGVNGAGIYIRNRDPEFTQIFNCAIQNSKSKFNNGDGIRVENAVIGASVNSNEVYQNTGAGINISNVPTPVFVSRNVAYANSPNYIGVPPANIVEGTTAALPPTVGFLNASITPA